MYITVKIQENTNKFTVLQYNIFTIKILGFQHVFNLSCGSSSGSAYQYLHKKSTLLCSQELFIDLYAEPTESSSHPHNIFLLNTV